MENNVVKKDDKKIFKSTDKMTLKMYLSVFGKHKRNLDDTILNWDIKTNKMNMLESKDFWEKRIKEFFNEKAV